MIRNYIFLLLVLFMSCHTDAQITTRVVKDGLFIPWEIIYGPDGNIWFTQKNGFICRVNPGTAQTDTLYHETATVIRNEGGMTGMALHPSFATQPYVYVAHNYLQGTAYKIRIMRYTYNGINALNAPAVILDNINGSNNHNGTRLCIVGDKLFVTTGDAESPSVAQNVSAVNGKVLRINLDGTIPSDNPYPGSPVWSWGHRNAQGLVMANGFLYSSEHGANSDDEINIIRKGRNYGWPNVEGFCNTPAEITFCTDSNVVTPLIAWTPTLAVSGIDYYDQAMFPQWQGCLLMNTLKDQHLYLLKLNSTRDSVVSASVITQVSAGRLRDICISPSGRVYISTSNSSASGTGAFTDKIIEIYDASATNVPATAQLGMKVYPNPVQQLLQVSLTQSIDGTYLLRDMQGRLLQQGAVVGKDLSLDLSTYVSGIYHLLIRTAGGAHSGQIFIKR
jgi:aldose sugar dehydrogenase